MTTILDVYRDHGVTFATSGGKVTPGWIGTACPWCNSSDAHLGVNVAGLVWSCWRCGVHPGVETLERLCGVSRARAVELLRGLRGDHGRGALLRRDAEVQAHIGIHPYRRPSDVGPLRRGQRVYLEGRGFDPDELTRCWGVLGTGPASYLDRVDYRHRVLAPIVWEGREVSFQARDTTGRAERRYVACPREREAIHHKAIVYASPRAPARQSVGIAVEGITDAWRLGEHAFATFGTGFTVEQLGAIAGRYECVAVAFDGEPQAQRRGRSLAARLDPIVPTVVLDIGEGRDPGGMPPDDARHLVREVLRWAGR
jgi:hypothetical protein